MATAAAASIASTGSVASLAACARQLALYELDMEMTRIKVQMNALYGCGAADANALQRLLAAREDLRAKRHAIEAGRISTS